MTSTLPCIALLLFNYHSLIARVDKKLAEPLLDWEAIEHKGVRTRDGVELGNVVEVDNKKLITIQGLVNEKEFILPHTVVAEFNGTDVRLNITYEEAKKFLAK